MEGPPSFFSIDFHLRFLPGVIRRRLFPPKETGTRFGPGPDFLILVGGCALLLVFGLPGALGPEPTVVGVLLSLLGGGGLLALAVAGVRSVWGIPPSYEQFAVGVFFFCVAAGASAGLFYSALFVARPVVWMALAESHAGEHLLWALAGAVPGYLLGIPAGLWTQRLGLLATVPAVLAWPGIIGLLVTDVVVLNLK